MSCITTGLTRLLGIRTPIVCAPMAGASGGALAAQVTLGGGFGFLAAGYDTPEKFGSEISIARSLLQSDTSSPLRIGVGYLGWQLEESNSKSQELLSIALDNNVQAIWFAFGSDLGRWVQFVRNFERPFRDTKIKIFVQVSSTEEALIAINHWKVDVVVAQGIEAGGHGYSSAPPLLTLISSILSIAPKEGPPVLAAGGLANGAHVASLLALGASGVVLGTRFLLSPESLYTDVQKQAIVSSKTAASVRTMAFEYARGTLGWPRGVDGRGLRNSTVEDFEKGVSIEVLRSRFDEGVRNSDPDRIVIWGGTGIGLMNDIMPAKDIVDELCRECTEKLRAAALLCD